MAELIQLRTRSRSHGCTAQSFVGTADLRGRTGTVCSGSINFIATMRGGDIVDVEGTNPLWISFDFANFVPDPGWVKVNPGDCPDSSAVCMIRGGLSETPTVRSFTFQQLATQTLTVIQDDPTQPAITSDPAGINCGGDCSEVYDTDDVITLTAGLNPGYLFDFWMPGPGQGSNLTSNPLVLTMDRSWTLTAFYRLALVAIGDGNATFVSPNVVEAIPAPNNYLVGVECV